MIVHTEEFNMLSAELIKAREALADKVLSEPTLSRFEKLYLLNENSLWNFNYCEHPIDELLSDFKPAFKIMYDENNNTDVNLDYEALYSELFGELYQSENVNSIINIYSLVDYLKNFYPDDEVNVLELGNDAYTLPVDVVIEGLLDYAFENKSLGCIFY